MAPNIKLYLAILLATYPFPQPVQALVLVILFAVTVYQVTKPQIELGTHQEPPDVTSRSHRGLQPAVRSRTLTRPPLRRQNCFVLGPNSLTSPPLSPILEVDSPSTSDSEGYGTVSEDAASARTMAETRALEYFEERLRRHQESVSSETSASQAAPRTPLTSEQIRDAPDAADSCTVDEDAEMLRRRNIKMREEGVRVTVNYSRHLTGLKPAPAPRSQPAFGSSASQALATTASSPSSSGSSAPSTTPPLSGVLSPAPTPSGGITSTGITTPEHTPASASVLPTSGRAAKALDRIDEKLLAIPADAVSRRLLRDGRASLYRSKTLSKSVSFAGGNSGQRTPSPADGGMQGSKSEAWYPSELVE